MRLLLIRHGQTVDNVSGALGTVVPGPGLTELGHRQAAAIPEGLADQPLDALYISTMTRTRLTAEPLAASRGLEPTVVDGLQEIFAGDIEGRSDESAVRTYLSTLFAWWTDLDARMPGGESGTEFYARYDAAIDSIARAHPDGAVAVFSHGAAIRAWVARTARNIDASSTEVGHLDNTAVVVLEGSPEEGWVSTHWAGTPVGGIELQDTSAPDPTGDAA